jgi:hypothetical protein
MADSPSADDLAILLMLHAPVNLDSQSLRLTSTGNHTDQSLLHVKHQNPREKEAE